MVHKGGSRNFGGGGGEQKKYGKYGKMRRRGKILGFLSNMLRDNVFGKVKAKQ